MIAKLLLKIKHSDSLDSAKAYADCIEMFLDSQNVKTLILRQRSFDNYPIINIIKELRTIFGYDLKEAKDIAVDGHKWTDLKPEVAKVYFQRLEALGANVELV